MSELTREAAKKVKDLADEFISNASEFYKIFPIDLPLEMERPCDEDNTK
jgi:hypothetical protein